LINEEEKNDRSTVPHIKWRKIDEEEHSNGLPYLCSHESQVEYYINEDTRKTLKKTLSFDLYCEIKGAVFCGINNDKKGVKTSHLEGYLGDLAEPVIDQVWQPEFIKIAGRDLDKKSNLYRYLENALSIKYKYAFGIYKIFSSEWRLNLPFFSITNPEVLDAIKRWSLEGGIVLEKGDTID